MKQELLLLVQHIPYGMVVSYGALAIELDKKYGIHTSGWMVGRILSQMSVNEWKWSLIPRWRVVNKQWIITSLKLWERWLEQIRLLSQEWIHIEDGKVDMSVYEYNL